MQPSSENWFEYPVQVHAHHTDYAGAAWHGTYVSWLEEARVEYLRSVGVQYADWVADGYELPVVELLIRYHQFLHMGKTAVIKTRMLKPKGIRLPWEYQIQSRDGKITYVTAQVTLVAVERQSGKIMRRLPAEVKAALSKLLPESDQIE